MSDIPFFRTVMGQRFFEATVPAVTSELQRLNANLERLAAALERLPLLPTPSSRQEEAR